MFDVCLRRVFFKGSSRVALRETAQRVVDRLSRADTLSARVACATLLRDGLATTTVVAGRRRSLVVCVGFSLTCVRAATGANHRVVCVRGAVPAGRADLC